MTLTFNTQHFIRFHSQFRTFEVAKNFNIKG